MTFSTMTESDLKKQLAEAIEVYEKTIEADWHDQYKEFHRKILNDAQVTLKTGENPFGKTAQYYAQCAVSRQPVRSLGLEHTLSEVYEEIRTLCYSHVNGLPTHEAIAKYGKGGTGKRARVMAAQLLGVQLSQFDHVQNRE